MSDDSGLEKARQWARENTGVYSADGLMCEGDDLAYLLQAYSDDAHDIHGGTGAGSSKSGGGGPEAMTLPCGHDERYEVNWREHRSYAIVNVNFCIACNYESVTKKMQELAEEARKS